MSLLDLDDDFQIQQQSTVTNNFDPFAVVDNQEAGGSVDLLTGLDPEPFPTLDTDLFPTAVDKDPFADSDPFGDRSDLFDTTNEGANSFWSNNSMNSTDAKVDANTDANTDVNAAFEDLMADNGAEEKPVMNDLKKSEAKGPIDYVRQRYEGGRTEFEKLQLRNPKKLDVQWGKTEQDLEGKTGKKLPQEQDVLTYTSLGVDYGKLLLEKNAQKDNREPPSPTQQPVNKVPVEKVAPPEITRNVRAIFETGKIPDLHEVKRQEININDSQDAGVFENDPTEVNPEILRESDTMEEVAMPKGSTQSARDKWVKQSQERDDRPRGPVQIAEDDGFVLENEPVQRSDVVRETDQGQEFNVGYGHARNLRHQFQNYKEPEKLQKSISLYDEADLHTPTVIENEPAPQRADVVRSTEEEHVIVAPGKAKNLAGYFLSGNSQEKSARQTPIEIERDGGFVLENEPVARTDVIREADTNEDVQLERGRARNIASVFQNQPEEYKPKGFKWDVDITDEPTILENEPEVRSDVVRESQEEIITSEPGRARKLATKFLNQDEGPKAPREKIIIERSDEPEVIENTPEYRDDVVRSDYDYRSNDPEVESGKARNLKQYWATRNDDVVVDHGEKPIWMSEIEEARALKTNVEEEDEERPEYEEPEEDVKIPEAHTKGLRDRWLRMQEEEESRLRKEQCPEFTPEKKAEARFDSATEEDTSLKQTSSITDLNVDTNKQNRTYGFTNQKPSVKSVKLNQPSFVTKPKIGVSKKSIQHPSSLPVGVNKLSAGEPKMRENIVGEKGQELSKKIDTVKPVPRSSYRKFVIADTPQKSPFGISYQGNKPSRDTQSTATSLTKTAGFEVPKNPQQFTTKNRDITRASQKPTPSSSESALVGDISKESSTLTQKKPEIGKTSSIMFEAEQPKVNMIRVPHKPKPQIVACATSDANQTNLIAASKKPAVFKDSDEVPKSGTFKKIPPPILEKPKFGKMPPEISPKPKFSSETFHKAENPIKTPELDITIVQAVDKSEATETIKESVPHREGGSEEVKVTEKVVEIPAPAIIEPQSAVYGSTFSKETPEDVLKKQMSVNLVQSTGVENSAKHGTSSGEEYTHAENATESVCTFKGTVGGQFSKKDNSFEPVPLVVTTNHLTMNPVEEEYKEIKPVISEENSLQQEESKDFAGKSQSTYSLERETAINCLQGRQASEGGGGGIHWLAWGLLATGSLLLSWFIAKFYLDRS